MHSAADQDKDQEEVIANDFGALFTAYVIHQGEEEAEEEDEDQQAYNYLLSMPLWSLTYERVQQLLKEKAEKEVCKENRDCFQE